MSSDPTNPVAAVHIVTEVCPGGCDSPVVLVRSRSDGRLLAWCAACEAAWDNPADFQTTANLESALTHPLEYSPSGLELATEIEIENSGWPVSRVSTSDAHDFKTAVEEFNRQILRS